MSAAGIVCSFVEFCEVINTDTYSNIKVLLDNAHACWKLGTF